MKENFSSIPFNWPYMTGKELHYIADAHSLGSLAGDGKYTKMCEAWLQTETKSQKALLTHSCTAALEMAAILAGIEPGDEVIMPSYTFVSTANAFVLRGAVPVFVDIRKDTLNLDEAKIEAAITPKTKAIVVVHYAGVACEMNPIMEIASKHDLIVIEDAAQGVMASYKERPLGSIGHMGCFSFHETKNVISGEGGALLVNDSKFANRAEILREKGTNRTKFFRGEVDKYTWMDVGSSYLPGEVIAAFLYAQLEEAHQITAKRLAIWKEYQEGFGTGASDGCVQLPIVPRYCSHNAHMYYLLLKDGTARDMFIQRMKGKNINCVFHYIPLHSSPAGIRFGRVSGHMEVTDNLSGRLVRLPLWIGLESSVSYIVEQAREVMDGI
jgi:dTDP-4-amino-4,6-dideoxygalactose transaminase